MPASSTVHLQVITSCVALTVCSLKDVEQTVYSSSPTLVAPIQAAC